MNLSEHSKSEVPRLEVQKDGAYQEKEMNRDVLACSGLE